MSQQKTQVEAGNRIHRKKTMVGICFLWKDETENILWLFVCEWNVDQAPALLSD